MTEEGRPTLEAGMLVALSVTPDTTPHTAPVGEIQAVDEHGVRITLMDWIVGTFTGSDLFVPWRNVEAAMVFTSEHSRELFGDDAARWQKRMKQILTPTKEQ